MNYRHAFHAGNFADVMKHVVLVRIIEHLKAKPAPFRVLDLHAGVGLYDLLGEEASRTGEWRDGVGRLYLEGSCRPEPLPNAVESLLQPWRNCIAAVNDGIRLSRYPGSPEIARRLARAQDGLLFNELHPQDQPVLAKRFAREKRAKIVAFDASIAAKAFLPPPERRGLVLLDPPYETADETSRMANSLLDGHRRFATGVFCLWYPVKSQSDANALARRIASLGLPKTLRAELTVRRADKSDRLNGSGLILLNPPWLLEGELGVLLPALAERLGDRSARFPGGWRLEWLVGEAAPQQRQQKEMPDPRGGSGREKDRPDVESAARPF